MTTLVDRPADPPGRAPAALSPQAALPLPPDIGPLFESQRVRDSRGHGIHVWCGMFWCACAAGPTILVEVGMIPLIACFLIRYPRHVHLHSSLGQQWASRLLLAWVALVALSLLWTADRGLGLEELAVFRYALGVLLLWPIMDRRRHLIGALVAGILAANLAQVAHAAGSAFGLDWLTFDRREHRNSGWWQPVVGGTILTAALGLHLPALLTGRSLRERGVGLLGCAASLLGVLATGSRGAWLASAMLVIAATVWAAFRWRRAVTDGTSAGLSWGHAPAIAAALVLVGFGACRLVGESVAARARIGIEEVQRALREKNYTTDTGARILMAGWAWEAYLAHPIQGLGAGGFRAYSVERLRAESGGQATLSPTPAPTPPSPELLHAHPHNAALHVAATTGTLGLLIALALAIVVFRDAFRPASGEPMRGYDAGPALALVGLLLVSPFDVVHVNNQTAAVLWTLVALCVRVRPASVPPCPPP